MSSGKSRRKRPNILVFMADQLKAPDAGGMYPCPTPNLDRVAREGIRFTETICSTPLCSPSRATFHTGLLPSFHGILQNVHIPYAHKELNPELPTLASVLRAAGYRTAISGAWHVSERTPLEQYGFERVSGEKGMLRVGDETPSIEIKLPDDDFSGKSRLAAVLERESMTYGSETEVATAVQYLEEFSRTPQEPFFLFCSIRLPHVPWNITRQFFDQVPTDVPVPESFAEDLKGLRRPRNFEYNGCDYAYWQGTGNDMRVALRCYYAVVMKVDELVGLLLDTLSRLNMEEDTFVIVTSDHGEMAGAHNLVGKGFDFYDEIIRIPFLMRRPGQIEAGRTCQRLVTFEDIMPTLCELAGAPVPKGCQGRSLSPFFQSGQADIPWRQETLLEHYGDVFPNFGLALRSKEQLYAWTHLQGEHLFDRRNDPSEINDLADDMQVQEHRERLLEHLREINHPLAKRVVVQINSMG